MHVGGSTIKCLHLRKRSVLFSLCFYPKANSKYFITFLQMFFIENTNISIISEILHTVMTQKMASTLIMAWR